ncbi:MAG: hypothetical protein E7272_07740 [Pseudobutyrivibrio ruminis]|uniref:YqaJ viral recombinase domain-containing protein n=1 Tax=Pseudobutyrivibrio ruminis TaxID=46206 RepID=A0A927YME2_9FIRM|nr:hypothetical protein [Pseudobutyrivibrio ruminis]
MFKANNNVLDQGVKPIALFQTEGLKKKDWLKYPTVIQEEYAFDEESETYYLPDETFSEWQNHIPTLNEPVQIGASTVSNIVVGSKELEEVAPKIYYGLMDHSFKCRSQLHYEKSGIPMLLKEQSNDDIFFVGHNEEPSIRRAFMRLYEKKHPEDIVILTNDKTTYRCGITNSDGSLKYPFMICNHDGFLEINGYEGIIECKTVAPHSPARKLIQQKICPFAYFCQVQYMLKCFNRAFGFIVFKMGMALTDYVIIRIDRDNEFIDVMMNLVAEFVAGVISCTEPSIEGQNVEQLNKFYRAKAGNYNPKLEPVELPTECSEVLEDIMSLNVQMKMLLEQKEDLLKDRNKLLVEKIFPIVQEANEAYCETKYGKIIINLKNDSQQGIRFNEQKFKDEKPELYESYSKTLTVVDKDLLKNEQPAIYEQYSIRSEYLTPSKENYCEVKICG